MNFVMGVGFAIVLVSAILPKRIMPFWRMMAGFVVGGIIMIIGLYFYWR